MMSIFPQELTACCISDKEFELAYAKTDAQSRALVKSCLAIIHRLHNEEPCISKSTRAWPDAGLCITQTQKPVTWAFIHCPSTTHFVHLAAAVMVVRLAYVESCFVVFDDTHQEISPNLLMALELCGHPQEHSFHMDEAKAIKLIEAIPPNKQGRIVLLGDMQTSLAQTAIQRRIPMLFAEKPENIITDNMRDHFQNHFAEHHPPEDPSTLICMCPNLTPSLFLEQTLFVTQLSENTTS